MAAEPGVAAAAALELVLGLAFAVGLSPGASHPALDPGISIWAPSEGPSSRLTPVVVPDVGREYAHWSKQDLLRALRDRDRAIPTFRALYSQRAIPAREGEPPAWEWWGWWAHDRGRVAASRWILSANRLPQWEWAHWDGSRSQGVSAWNVEAAVGAEPHSLARRLPAELEPRNVAETFHSPILRALSSDFGQNTGLFYYCEPWSHRLGRARSEFLGIEDAGGKACFLVVFDQNESKSASSDEHYSFPYLVWLETETLVAWRIQAYVDSANLAKQGKRVEPPEGHRFPPRVREGYVPLIYQQVLETRQLHHGIHVATRVERGVTSSGSGLESSQVEIFEVGLLDPRAVEAAFEPPVAYPLTVLDKTSEERYVIASPRGERFSTYDFAFWEGLRRFGSRVAGREDVDYELEHLLGDGTSCALGVLLFWDRAMGRATPVEGLVQSLPEKWRREGGDLEADAVESAARSLGLQAERIRGDLSDFASIERPVVAHLRAGNGDGGGCHFAWCWIDAERPECVSILVPGVRFQNLSVEEFATVWRGELTRVSAEK